MFALLSLCTAGVTSAVTSSPAPVGDVRTDVDRAIADLVGDDPARALADLPEGFAATMGYRPVVEDGRPVNPDGSCSSPIRLPARFEGLCRAHDFGYDLLRFGARTGREPAPWARRALDDMLVDAMHRACTNPLCDVAATVSDGGLTLNSWRQEWRAPTRESTSDLASSTLHRVVDVIGRRS
ncbi:hypothetical protein ACFOJ6_02165 [Gordonia humi]|uniref:hypothetical protein n=1 Tax=Gordonia humi TaxID=686429 RepID=UPI003619EBF3